MDNNNQVIADRFADYFMEKILTIRKQLDTKDLFSPSPRHVETLRSFRLLSEEEVESIIKSLSSKSCELDVIPTNLLKDILPSILPLVTRLVNTSLKEGLFVETWKLAIVRPLLKKIGLDLIGKNYRPVSNLPFLSKVLEKAALDQFIAHCDNHSLLPDYQSAYRKHYSCETALIKLTNDVLWSMENGKVSVVVMIDLSAAFDTVDHDLLLEVLETRFGIKDTCLKWYENYLRPRAFRVCVKDCYSEEKNLTFSVPQGSLNGPFLYLAYASTIQNLTKIQHCNTSIYGFADDHALRAVFTSGNENESRNIREMENTMDDVKEWMDLNRLKMNCSKTEFILMGSRQQLKKSETDSINICGNTITASPLVKYLGTYLDQTLSLKSHITKKCKAAMFNLLRIKNVRHLFDLESVTTMILSLVISHLDYANAVMVGLPTTDLKKLQRVQNIAAKLILGKRKYDSASECLKQLHWLPIIYRIQFKILCIVFKAVQLEVGPLYIRNLLTLLPERRPNLRSNRHFKHLLVPKTDRKTFASRSFAVMGPLFWNSLPNDIKSVGSYEIFKNKLKTHLFREAFQLN